MAVDFGEMPTDFGERRRWALARIAESPDNAVQVLEHFRDTPQQGWVTHTAARILGERADPRGVALAVELLGARPLPGRAHHLVMLLGLARDPAAVPVVADVLLEGVRRGRPRPDAADALSRIGTPDAVVALLRAAELCKPETVDEQLVRALCRTGTRAAVDHIVEWSGRIPRMWYPDTLSAVARLSDPRLTPFLVEVCAGPHRPIGLRGLSLSASERGYDPLVHILLTTASRRERALAARALNRIMTLNRLGSLRCSIPVDGDVRARRNYAWLLGRMVGQAYHAAEYALDLADDAEPLVRAQAAQSIGLLGVRPEQSLRFSELLADDSYRVRTAAATAMGLVSERNALAQLDAMAAEDEVGCVREAATAAVRALRRPPRPHP